jgi:hypothetical protein
VEAGLEAGVDDGGSDEGGAEDGGVDDGGAEDGGAEEGGAEEGGADDGGADEGGAEDDGAPDDGGADDGADDEDLVGGADLELPGWTDTELIDVGAREVAEDQDVAGLTNELGDSEAGAAGDALGPACGFVPTAGAVARLPAADCGLAELPGGVRPAPISAMAATADPATRPPVRQTEATGREMR